MTWSIAVSALGFVFIGTALVSLVGYSPKSKPKGVLQDYLLAGGSLTTIPVLNLLLSTSFGINTMLYQGYLGATVGYWGLVVQAAWSGGFFFLRPYAKVIRQYKGVHHFLGSRFGAGTRRTAAFCSLVGITVFLGWETSIGRDALAGILARTGGEAKSVPAAGWLTLALVIGCLLYTLLGGLRANAWANVLQNILKFLTFGWVTVLIGVLFVRGGGSFWAAFAPPLPQMVTNLGWWGVVTSIAFGLAWQFVDTTTWQSVAAASESSDADLERDISLSGYLVFITPGILGTLFGIFLSNTSDGAANAVVAAARLIADQPPVVHFLYAAAIMAAVLSLIDGLFLASAYALVVDLMHPNEAIEDLDSDEDRATRILAVTRALLVLIAALSIWGVPLMISLLNRDLFFFSFVVVIAQLALFGPIVIGLKEAASQRRTAMWLPILVALLAGFGFAMYGAVKQIKFLTDGAGTFTLIISFVGTWLVREYASRRAGRDA